MVIRSRRFRGGAEAPRSARHAVREQLCGTLPAKRLGDVELLVSELATNSIRHGGCDESAELALEADVRPDRVRVKMFDEGSGFEAATPAPPPAGATGGYGLVLLDRLADRWGVQRGKGFCVWFEVERSHLA